MDKSLEDKLYDLIAIEDMDSISNLILQGANPNKITRHGKTCLGEAANIGNTSIVKILIEACRSSCDQQKSSQSSYKKKHTKLQKRKLRTARHSDETVNKCKNVNDRTLGGDTTNENILSQRSNRENNQGYFVFIHNEGSSSDESKISNLKSPVSSTSLITTPQAELEWDEEILNFAPSTSEDESWSSTYRWYAAILEDTGAAIASASVVLNGIDQHDAFMRTALHYAVEQGHVEIVKLIIDAGCKIDVAAGDGLTSLHIAVMRNHKDIVEELLAAGSHVNYKTHEKMTPLHFAASRGYVELIKILVNNGAYLEARDTNERTALYLAAGRGHVEVIKFLISVGANVNGEEIHGYTPLCEAVWQRFTKVVEILLASGARVTHSHKLLHNAIIQRQENIVRMLADVGGGINLHNDSGDTPLLLSVRLSQPAIALTLLKRGANINSYNSINGSSALHIAVECIDCPKEFEEMLLCLLKYGIDLNASALTGDTPLNRAMIVQKDHAAVLLIRHGADVNACDLPLGLLNNLAIASRRSTINLSRLLLKAGHQAPISEANISISKQDTTLYWLYYTCKDPLSLLDLCRIKIRNCRGNMCMSSYINSLGLPKSLQRFLMLENED